MLSKLARDRSIRYFLISFTDLFGVQRAKLVPAQVIDSMAEDGAGFAGFSTWFDMSPADPDLAAIPDPNSMFQLPWQPDVAWMPADLYHENGQPLAQTPRLILKRMLERAEAQGYHIKTGVECEYLLLSANGEEISDERDRAAKPCYDQQALMRRFDVVGEICDAMLSLGWQPYQNDHEDANGQFEMNWKFDDALVTADRHAFFKYMTKAIAEKHGFRATFMPKPFANLTGNGCHMHVSAWDTEGKTNLFANPEAELGLSSLAYHFIGGVLDSASALCAFTNPTINSYKRINSPTTASGATWSPNSISYSGNNRTHMIRVPGAGRFEFRLADGATNPYLFPASVIAAGLDGIAQKKDPGKRYNNDNYNDPLPSDQVKQLPATLSEALHCLEANTVLSEALGEEVVAAYLKLKSKQWQDYSSQITAWERDQTLDC